MAFQTALYKQKRDNYKTLSEELSTKLTEHRQKKRDAKAILDGYTSTAGELDGETLPSKYYEQSTASIVTNLKDYLTRMSENETSLSSAKSSASTLAADYESKYQTEKQREIDHKAAEERKKKEKQEKEKNKK